MHDRVNLEGSPYREAPDHSLPGGSFRGRALKDAPALSLHQWGHTHTFTHEILSLAFLAMVV